MDDELSYERIDAVYDVLKPAYDAFEWNGPSFCMLVQELEGIGKPLGELTFAEFAVISARVGESYNGMFKRLRELGYRGESGG
jgi:hypothetical protein